MHRLARSQSAGGKLLVSGASDENHQSWIRPAGRLTTPTVRRDCGLTCGSAQPSWGRDGCGGGSSASGRARTEEQEQLRRRAEEQQRQREAEEQRRREAEAEAVRIEALRRQQIQSREYEIRGRESSHERVLADIERVKKTAQARMTRNWQAFVALAATGSAAAADWKKDATGPVVVGGLALLYCCTARAIQASANRLQPTSRTSARRRTDLIRNLKSPGAKSGTGLWWRTSPAKRSL